VLAPAVAGIFISSVGLAPSFQWLLWLVFLGGAGIASFHPQASARVTLGVEASRGRWMAVFISSGTLGLACGPTFFSLVSASVGLEATWMAALPGVLATLLLFAFLQGDGAPTSVSRRFDTEALREVWKPLAILYFLVFIRSVVQITFTQFLPLYLNHERGYTVTEASFALSLYLACGALGGFLGGSLADRIGGRRVILLSMTGSAPFLMLFFFASGWLALAGLALGGLVLLFTIPVNVVMAQQLAPKQVGTVSALMMGFAWGMAGLIFIPLTGMLADWLNLHAVLSALALFPLAGVLLTLKLPR
jgi:FSR family fosmidomycin resistance protein-like MFS transporter